MIEMIVGHPHIFWLSLGGLLLAAEMLGGNGYLLWSGVGGHYRHSGLAVARRLGMAGCYLCRLNAACRLVLVEVDGETRS